LKALGEAEMRKIDKQRQRHIQRQTHRPGLNWRATACIVARSTFSLLLEFDSTPRILEREDSEAGSASTTRKPAATQACYTIRANGEQGAAQNAP
jgi:hypothetical protein